MVQATTENAADAVRSPDAEPGLALRDKVIKQIAYPIWVEFMWEAGWAESAGVPSFKIYEGYYKSVGGAPGTLTSPIGRALRAAAGAYAAMILTRAEAPG